MVSVSVQTEQPRPSIIPGVPGAVYRFGVFEINPISRQILKAGRELHLQEQPLRLLALLLERPGELRTREELQKLLWPTETFVEFDDGLNTAIQKIRQVLGDEARNPRFVETVPRQGYRFIAPVERNATPLITVNPVVTPIETPVQTKLPAAPPANRFIDWRIVAAAAVVIGAGIGWLIPRNAPTVSSQPMRFAITPPPGVEMRHGIRGGSAISPDGKFVVFAGSREGKDQLWVRGINSADARELAGTEGGFLPFWSPDSKSIGFLSAGRLRRVDLTSGPAADLAAVIRPTRGAWMDDGTILFATGSGGPIHRVKATGGAVSVATLGGQRGGAFPFPIPNKDRFLFYNNNNRTVEMAALSGDGKTMPILNSDSMAVFAPAYGANPAHVLWLKGTTLVAQPFDADHGALSGEAAPVADDVGFTDDWHFLDLSVSSNGMLLYGSGNTVKTHLAWVRRDGSLISHVTDPDWMRAVRLSSDGHRALIVRGIVRTLWTYDFDRNVQTRATFEQESSGWPAWSPDGSQFVYSGRRGARNSLYRRKSGGGPDEVLTKSEFDHYPYDWSRDGKYLIYCEVHPQTKLDLWILPLTGDRKPFPFLKTPFNEDAPRFSPDMRWVVYTSDESGRNEIYVARFPNADVKWQISTTGGSQPRWSTDGREILYESSAGYICSVPVHATTPQFEWSGPRKLFANPLRGRHYELSPRGDRFLVMMPPEGAGRNELTVVVNWQDALHR